MCLLGTRFLRLSSPCLVHYCCPPWLFFDAAGVEGTSHQTLDRMGKDQPKLTRPLTPLLGLCLTLTTALSGSKVSPMDVMMGDNG